MANTPDIKLQEIEDLQATAKVCQDFYMGYDSVAKETYLPKLANESNTSYTARLATTPFTNFVAPVVDGIAGIVTKRPPTITDIDRDTYFLNNIDMQGNNLESFAKECLTSSLLNGVSFIVALSTESKDRIYLKHMQFKNLISYKIKENKLIQVVFKDEVYVEKGEFGSELQVRYLVFKAGEGGSVWYANKNGGELVKQSDWTNTLKDIPIVIISTGKGNNRLFQTPKFYDIARLNQVHLGIKSLISNMMDIVGNPIISLFGYSKEGDEGVTISYTDALLFDDKSTQGVTITEANGNGINLLKTQADDIAKDISELTFTLLSNSANTRIEAEANTNRNSSYVSDIANEIEQAINTIIGFAGELSNKPLPKKAYISYQKDFTSYIIDLKIAKDLLNADKMSLETFYSILKTGELPSNFNAKDEADRLQ